MSNDTAPTGQSIEELEAFIAADNMLLRQAYKVWDVDKIKQYRADIIANLKALVAIYETLWLG